MIGTSERPEMTDTIGQAIEFIGHEESDKLLNMISFNQLLVSIYEVRLMPYLDSAVTRCENPAQDADQPISCMLMVDWDRIEEEDCDKHKPDHWPAIRARLLIQHHIWDRSAARPDSRMRRNVTFSHTIDREEETITKNCVQQRWDL